MSSHLSTAKQAVKDQWQQIDSLRLETQAKVLAAFQSCRVDSECFGESTGYGLNDSGRAKLERVFAAVFRTESALVRPQIVSGTHAIHLGLSLLEPGQQLVSVSGAPYDTLQQVIGTKGNASRSLISRGIHYRQIDLTPSGDLDLETIEKVVSDKTSMVVLQRSRGYSLRPAICIDSIQQVFSLVKAINPNCICFVDNCYGEFVEKKEPTEVGADLMAGSLIKNPGGSLAPCGGYLVGRGGLIQQCASILTAPGLGTEVGPTLGLTRVLLHGVFIAPHITAEALCGAILAAQVFQSLGFSVSPLPTELRSDIIQAIVFQDKQLLLAFCSAIQAASPVDSYLTPIPSPMPGYEDEVIMAGGTFIQGASIELSADAPMRHPYAAFLQGGICKEHVELAIEMVLQRLRLS